jgi:signal transduction histidine kinase
VLVIAALVLGGYVFGAPQFYAAHMDRHAAGMAIHTSAGLIVLAHGVLCARGTSIDVHVKRAVDMVEITVTNEGPGIEPDEIPLLFSRFARTRAARRGPAPGLGLGLYISSGLIEAQGGRMWVESTPGQRTSFHFTLPGAQPVEADQ